MKMFVNYIAFAEMEQEKLTIHTVNKNEEVHNLSLIEGDYTIDCVIGYNSIVSNPHIPVTYSI